MRIARSAGWGPTLAEGTRHTRDPSAGPARRTPTPRRSGPRARPAACWVSRGQQVGWSDRLPPHALLSLPTTILTSPPRLAVPCARGTGGVNCTSCRLGTYSSGGNATHSRLECQPCPAGFTTVQPASTNSTACAGVLFLPCWLMRCRMGTVCCLDTLTTACLAVQIRQADALSSHPPPNPAACHPGYGGALCEICAVGSYSGGGGNSSKPKPDCTPCPVNTITAGTGSTGIEMCTPSSGDGQPPASKSGYWILDRQPRARLPNGTFDVIARHSSRMPCRLMPSGIACIWAATAGAVCRPGTGGSNCTACQRGSYSPGGASSVECIKCSSGFTTLTPLATGPEECSGEEGPGRAGGDASREPLP